ncbi:hypothetical protein Y032_0011g1367 [Ancylostoma ceylanicum]|uniref:Uncharacterized protein n=1 Tax=Ancylostoma ceylanicum TaxID=53326 RepID=A0A016VEM7_9BILA|nr:hypothetical protein Y032_0011g1367 [Ancylostoma ceylanicum]
MLWKAVKTYAATRPRRTRRLFESELVLQIYTKPPYSLSAPIAFNYTTRVQKTSLFLPSAACTFGCCSRDTHTNRPITAQQRTSCTRPHVVTGENSPANCNHMTHAAFLPCTVHSSKIEVMMPILIAAVARL